jgi:DNA-directed RNA polymerase specialized sigma24 family protein
VLELVDEPVEVAPTTAGAPVEKVERVAAECVESFEAFYRREFPRLLLLARALAGDPWAVDIAHDSMLVAYRHWTRISRMDSPAGYVHRICAHKAVSWIRRASAERRALRRVTGRGVVTMAPISADSERFWAEVRRLPRRQAETVALFYGLDVPIPVIARTLACAEGTVKAHLARARAELSQRFAISEED